MKIQQVVRETFFSFPVQLLLLHFRSNLLLIGLWLLFLLLMTGTIGKTLGFHYLFLTPEYLGEVGFLSFSLLGMGFGAFFMTWNLTAYLLESHRFPFLACLARPFTKFCLNNLLLPLFFLLAYLFRTIHFQINHELWSWMLVLENVLGFLAGLLVFVSLNILYFRYTNKDILAFLKGESEWPASEDRSLAPGRRVPDLQTLREGKVKLPVITFLNESLRLRLVRDVSHYDASMLLRVFKQNHLNALIVQLLSLLVLIASGYLVDVPLFMIPAGTSLFVLASVIAALVGAVTYWFHEWRLTVILLLILGINFLTSRDVFTHRNKALGLNYENTPVTYNYNTLRELCDPETVAQDKTATLQILENWKTATGKEKPRMVFVCVTGGGLRAAVWAMRVMQTADSLLDGELTQHTVLMTGSSGGAIGMAYFRELLLRQRTGQEEVNPYSVEYINHLSRDILNAVAVTIVSSDLFLPWATQEYQGRYYRKDRGLTFETQLNRNTRGVFDKPLSAYREPEQQAQIPLMFLTPSIVNDGKRMVISPHGVSYMMLAPAGVDRPGVMEPDAVDFGRLFDCHDPDELRFSSALRMNATFPYVLPNVYLPTRPAIEVMDAGFRDNYGIMSAARFIHVFKDWIRENTSGVVLMQIRGRDKFDELRQDKIGVFESILEPLGVAGRLTDLQEYEHDSNLGFLFDILGPEHFEIIRFTYQPAPDEERASVTFHLTQAEKASLLKAIQKKEHLEKIQKLDTLLDTAH